MTGVEAYAADWEFSTAVTVAIANVPELEIDGMGLGFMSPEFVQQTGPTTIRAYYPGAVGPADAWQVLAVPPDISPPVVVPESGTVI